MEAATNAKRPLENEPCVRTPRPYGQAAAAFLHQDKAGWFVAAVRLAAGLCCSRGRILLLLLLLLHRCPHKRRLPERQTALWCSSSRCCCCCHRGVANIAAAACEAAGAPPVLSLCCLSPHGTKGPGSHRCAKHRRQLQQSSRCCSTRCGPLPPAANSSTNTSI